MSEGCVPDTGVLIALAAATGAWDVLEALEQPVVATPAVLTELKRGSPGSPGRDTSMPSCMCVWPSEIAVPAWLHGTLDQGEASVIALALQQGWREVAIDEAVGHSVARMCQLRLTGSLGILIRAKRQGYAIMLADAIARIGLSGIWIGEDVKRAALRAAEELPDAVDPGHEKQ